MKNLFFMSGLPRSGSTLLSNILNQNPEIYSSQTSGLVGVVGPIRDGWNQISEMRLLSRDLSYTRLTNVLRGVFDGYYSDLVDVPFVIDKNRAWLKYPEMLDLVVDDLKILVTVRDLREILSSLEKIWRKTAALGIPSQEFAHPQRFVSVQSRAEFWVASDQLVGVSYNLIKDALDRGFRSKMYFVNYKDLTGSPKATLEGIYNFLGIPGFDHDFDHVEQVIEEDDRLHGFVGLHDIRSKVVRQDPDYDDILGASVAAKFRGQELW